MVIPGTTPVVPSFPKNRRRMRRGARKRHALSRKVDPREEYREGFSLAHDGTFLPALSATFRGAQPQTLERSWLAWMAHEVRREEEDEQCRLFGGDADDDALRALGILYDSIRDDGDSESKAPAPASGVFTGINNVDNQDTKDGDSNFPPLPSSLQFALSRPTPKPRKTKRHNSRRYPLTIPTPPLLQSCLMDDSEIMRLTTIQSPEPAEQERPPRQSLPFPTQFPVPLQVPVTKPADHNDNTTTTAPTTTKANPTDPSQWTLIPQDPDWDLLDDDS